MAKIRDFVQIVMVQGFVNREENHITLDVGKMEIENIVVFCTHCFSNIFPDNPKTEDIREKK